MSPILALFKVPKLWSFNGVGLVQGTKSYDPLMVSDKSGHIRFLNFPKCSVFVRASNCTI